MTRCESCRFWSPVVHRGESTDSGFCRRYPPVHGVWPLTGKQDWCGEAQEHSHLDLSVPEKTT